MICLLEVFGTKALCLGNFVVYGIIATVLGIIGLIVNNYTIRNRLINKFSVISTLGGLVLIVVANLLNTLWQSSLFRYIIFTLIVFLIVIIILFPGDIKKLKR